MVDANEFPRLAQHIADGNIVGGENAYIGIASDGQEVTIQHLTGTCGMMPTYADMDSAERYLTMFPHTTMW